MVVTLTREYWLKMASACIGPPCCACQVVAGPACNGLGRQLIRTPIDALAIFQLTTILPPQLLRK